MTIGRKGAEFQVKIAKRKILRIVNRRGQLVKIFLNDDSTVQTDLYGSVTNRLNPYIEIYAFPVISNPTRKQIEKAGLFEEAEVLIYTAKLAWDNNNIEFKDINSIVSYIEIDGEQYNIRELATTGQHTNDYVYITFNLSKK